MAPLKQKGLSQELYKQNTQANSVMWKPPHAKETQQTQVTPIHVSDPVSLSEKKKKTKVDGNLLPLQPKDGKFLIKSYKRLSD